MPECRCVIPPTNQIAIVVARKLNATYGIQFSEDKGAGMTGPFVFNLLGSLLDTACVA